jgi:hypothetical protein
MPSIPARQRQQGLRLLAFAVASWVLIGSIGLFAFTAGETHADGATPPHRVTAARQAQPAPDAPPDIELLREEAAGGGHSQIRRLGMALMDRFDLAGDADDLAEAMTWVDREWVQFGDADMAARVLARYCGERVARLHPLCNLSE